MLVSYWGFTRSVNLNLIKEINKYECLDDLNEIYEHIQDVSNKE